MPPSIWASVPKKTRISDREKSTTVSRSPASALRKRQAAWPAPGRTAACGSSAGDTGTLLGVLWISLLLMAGSLEPYGFHERLEHGPLLADQVGIAHHLEEPRLAAADNHRSENAFLVA